MEQVTVSRVDGKPSDLLYLSTFPLVAMLGGRPVAFVERPVMVRSLVGFPGRVRYVGADRTVGVHLDHDPLDRVTEYPRDLITVVWGGTTLRGIEAFLAGRPAPVCDLDQAAKSDSGDSDADRRERNRAAGRCINENLAGTHGPATHGCRCQACDETHRRSRGGRS